MSSATGVYHSLACGLSWEVPQDHFPGVNGKGYVSYFEKVGVVGFGNDLKLPLIINFNSSNEKTSPYLGKSFTLFLLEANMVQISENGFMATQPDGSLNYFMRTEPNGNVLNGSAGWKGEINGDTITTWAPCGWKIEYYRGKIVSMVTPQNRTLNFVYSGETVTEIRENGTAKLAIEYAKQGEADALVFGGKRMQITLDQKPAVQNVQGQNFVGGMDQSLKTLDPTSGKTASFEFSVNQKVQPTLKITSNNNTTRLITWDPATKRIISDGDWVYTITPNQNSNAAIARANSMHQSEYWSYDAAKGQEITQGLNGDKTTRSWFVSGASTGNDRREETITKDRQKIVHEWIYDDNGQLVRMLESHGAEDKAAAGDSLVVSKTSVINKYIGSDGGFFEGTVNGRYQKIKIEKKDGKVIMTFPDHQVVYDMSQT